MNKLKILEAITFLAILCIGAFAGIARAGSAVGVQAGDWIKYTVTTGTEIRYWSKVTVDNVAGTVVSLTDYTSTTESDNWTDPWSFSIDIPSDCSGSSTIPFIVPAELSQGDSVGLRWHIYPFTAIHLFINDTTQWNGRDAVHAISTDSRAHVFGDVYWDRQKGVLLEASGYFNASQSGILYTIKLDSTNLWGGAGPDSWPWAPIIIVVVITSVISATALLLRRRKTSATPPLQKDQPLPPPPSPASSLT